MKMRKPVLLVLAGVLLPAPGHTQTTPNKVLGTWHMVAATLQTDDGSRPAYGAAPASLLVFTADGHVLEVLTDPTVPRFASEARGHGTAKENQAAMAGSIGWFGTYTVDRDGNFTGDRVEGSTFPNWVGNVRTSKDIQIVVHGDQLLESFRRPEGTTIVATWQRVRPHA